MVKIHNLSIHRGPEVYFFLTLDTDAMKLYSTNVYLKTFLLVYVYFCCEVYHEPQNEQKIQGRSLGVDHTLWNNTGAKFCHIAQT